MKKYVTGFLFSKDKKQVVLIKKINPKWQRGLLNGVGGKIEENELSCDAMVREFKEETGVTIKSDKWLCYAKIHRANYYDLDVYCAYSDLAYQVKTVEKEEVVIVKINNLPDNIIPNLKWLIPLALDKQTDFSSPILINEISQERIKA
ncbi:MAG: NUDIX hydrolase [Halarcobacter sp.]